MSEYGCIYLITCLVVENGHVKRYVGQTIYPTPDKRYEDHWKRRKINDCMLHRAMTKHGRDQFKVETLCVVPLDSLDRMEEYYADQYETYVWDNPGGYNMVWCGNQKRLNLEHTAETRSKISSKRMGIVFTEEHKAKLSEKAKQRPPRSTETREKIAHAMRTRVVKEETREKLSEIMKARPPPSLESRAKMSAAIRPPPTPETIAKRVAANTGKKRTEEAKERMRQKAFEREARKREERLKRS